MAHDRTKNWVAPKMAQELPCTIINGLPLPVVADLVEGGGVTISKIGMLEPQVGPFLQRGCMLVLLPPNIAEQLRNALYDHLDKLEQGKKNGGAGRGVIAT